jgi:hypothetical protein
MLILEEFGDHMCSVCGTDCVEVESQIDTKNKQIEALKNVLDAARKIHHWHAMRDGSGMVVSTSAVHSLWTAIHVYDRLS